MQRRVLIVSVRSHLVERWVAEAGWTGTTPAEFSSTRIGVEGLLRGNPAFRIMAVTVVKLRRRLRRTDPRATSV